MELSDKTSQAAVLQHRVIQISALREGKEKWESQREVRTLCCDVRLRKPEGITWPTHPIADMFFEFSRRYSKACPSGRKWLTSNTGDPWLIPGWRDGRKEKMQESGEPRED